MSKVLRIPTALLVIGSCAFPGSLPAQRALLDLLPPDADVAGHLEPAFGAEFTPLALPGEGTVFGLAKVGDRCWVLRGSELHGLDWTTKKVALTRPAPTSLVGLCADARFLYGIAGRDLHVLDPLAGTSMRTVPIAAAWPPSHLFEHRGDVHVVIDRTILTVDVSTGATKEVARMADAAHWLASDGKCLWRGSTHGCEPELGPTPAWPGRRWPQQALESSALWVDGQMLVALERNHGGKRNVAFGLVATTVADPGPSDRLMIVKEAGALAYLMLCAEPLVDDAALRTALQDLAAQPLLDRQRLLELSPSAGVTVRDVCKVWDLAVAAGFRGVCCPGLEAWGRDSKRAASAPASEPPKKGTAR